MATLSANNPTLMDVAKRLDPDGNIDKIVELLNETNEILDDATVLEGNLPTGHRTTVRTGIPTPTWRKLYGGVQPTKSTTVQVTDNTGMLEAYAEVDKALADLNGNTAAFRMSEDRPHIEGMNQEMADTLFYGNEGTEPEAFTGFAPRYNDLAAANATNIINAADFITPSGSPAFTSVWLILWGPNTTHKIYPKGSMAGLKMTDKGQVTIENADGNNGRMEAYRTHYRWDCGLTVRDWRYIVRIANLDTAKLVLTDPTSLKALVSLITMATERVPSLGYGRPAFYGNRKIREALRLGILEKISAQLTWETVAGKRVVSFDGIPFRRTDALVNNETEVV